MFVIGFFLRTQQDLRSIYVQCTKIVNKICLWFLIFDLYKKNIHGSKESVECLTTSANINVHRTFIHCYSLFPSERRHCSKIWDDKDLDSIVKGEKL
jgi:hypothetical protein